MIYRVDLSEDRQWLHFWTGLGKSSKESQSTDGSDTDYTFRTKLEGGFDVVGTRIEDIE